MADYEQVSSVNIKAMGKKKGWCLQNCRLVFGFTTGKYASAKVDMQSQRASGTLHSMDTLPTNVVVPVYVDTTGKYEHVIISYYGTFYEDGYKINRNKYSKFFGWGELCDGRRVVKWVEDAKKSNEEIAKEVIAGKWGNGDDRKNRLASAGYNYNTIQSLVNQMLSGNTSNRKSDTEIAKEVIQGKWGNGADRKNRLTSAGYNYNNIQAIVNKLLR